MCAKEKFQPGSITYRDTSLVMNDGVSLIARCWHPDKGGPWPALLMRQPYGRVIASTVTYAHPEWWAGHGYLVIVQDVRGQGDSEGNFNGFDQESLDTTQTHSWARSLPECNGKLGTFGFSYQGFTQLLATEDILPPDCLAPAMTGLDEGEHWSCEGGAYWWHLGITWGLQLAALQAKRKQNKSAWLTIRKALKDGTYLTDGEEILRTYDPKGMSLKWLLQSNNPNTCWKKHKPLNSWLQKPMLLIGGWWDPHLKGILDLYQLSNIAGGKPELHIGPATHLEWWEGTNQLQLQFFNKHLKNNFDNHNSACLHKIWNITTKEWEAPENLRELSKSSKLEWGLLSNGLACATEHEGILFSGEQGKGSAVLVHDPWRPVPAKGGHLAESPGIVDRQKIDLRRDVAKFTSKELSEKLSLEGIPSLKIKAHADQPGFDLCIALSIVDQIKQRVTQLSTGYLRVNGPEALENSIYQIFLQPLRADLFIGQKLRVSIAPSAWPAIGVNCGGSAKPFGASDLSSPPTTLSLDLQDSKLQFFPFIS